MMNAVSLLMWLTSHPKFWPKNPVTNVSGRKIVARIVSCSMVEFCRRLICVCSTEMTAMLAWTVDDHPGNLLAEQGPRIPRRSSRRTPHPGIVRVCPYSGFGASTRKCMACTRIDNA